MDPRTSAPTPTSTTPFPSSPLRITIRFATHQIPDLPLLIQATALHLRIHNLRHAIRPYVPPDLSDRALRLIHAGRVLEDAWTIGAALRVQQQQASRWKGKGRVGGLHGTDGRDGDGGRDVDAVEGGVGDKSKGEARDTALIAEGIQKDTDARRTNIFDRVYIHCSISPTVLTAAQLAAERIIAGVGDNDALASNNVHVATAGSSRGRADSSNISAAAQGFDRLLATAGFSAEDVGNLRSQFRSVVSSRHTPDTMPSPRTLLRMEENWLDGDAGRSGRGRDDAGGSAGGGEVIGADGGLEDEDTPRVQMYDTLYGVCMGFFWPLGALAWGLREEGVWSRRRGLAVLAGVGVNIGFGLVKVLG